MKIKQQEALQIDYGIYQFEWKEYLLYGVEFMMIILLFAYTFYRSYIVVVLFLPYLRRFQEHES